MLKISDAITKIIRNQPFISFGIKQRIFNLTKLAKLIKPYIEAQTKKSVQTTAVTMALSRFQNKIKDDLKIKYDYSIENLIVHTNLLTITYPKNPENSKCVKLLQDKSNQEKYIVVHQRPSEISIIVDSQILPLVEKYMGKKMLHKKSELCSVGVCFSDRLLDVPGFFMYLISNVSLQGINIYEIFSTYSELVFLVDQKDLTTMVETFSDLISNQDKKVI